jgi:hypothetical protein
MAVSVAEFNKQLTIAFAGLDQKSMDKALAKYAKQEVRKVIASGEASPQYETYINGARGPVDSVRSPGPVVFLFNNWPAIINTALASLIKMSPKRSGRFAASFKVIVGGRLVDNGSFDKIPMNAEVIITNAQPYIRKVEVGAMKMSVPPRIFDRTKRMLSGRYKEGFNVSVAFLHFGSGIHPLMPYHLKVGSKRKGRRAGDPINYPSIIIKAES